MRRKNIFITVITVICSGFLLAPSIVLADEPQGPPKPATRRLTTAYGLHLLNEGELRRVDRMQTAGHILLGTGLGVSLASIIVMEAVQWGAAAMAGFVSMGVGLATMISGMFCLGFSRPLHGYRPDD